MDFRTPPCVIDALVEKCRHGIYGYSNTREDYFEALRSWFSRHFDWDVRPEWLVKTPGVVFAICAAIRSLTDEGDAVIVRSLFIADSRICTREPKKARGKPACLFRGQVYHRF